jgi:DNA-binding NtrC family response regulator
MDSIEPPLSVAVVDDDPMVLSLMRGWLQAAGYPVSVHEEGRPFLRGLGSATGVVLLDLGLADISGLEVLRELNLRDKDLPVVAVTAGGHADAGTSALRSGAYDYVTKPLDSDRLLMAVCRAFERRRLALAVRSLQDALQERSRAGHIEGNSAAIQELRRQIQRTAESSVPVVLLGEKGSGKELVARAIHRHGSRREGPFVAINFASVPESLHEVELFGAPDRSPSGRFQQARGGTLFLDEVAHLSALTQASLLQVLQDDESDPRLVCATQHDLLAAVRAGRFREDLYFKLAVHPIQLPSLRDRRDDIPALTAHFLDKYQSFSNRRVGRVHPAALEALVAYDWPGNVRELEDVVHRSLLAAHEDEIRLEHLPPHLKGGDGSETDDLWGARADTVLPMREVERRAIKRALRATNGSVEKAAKLLGMGRATLYRRLAHYDASNQSL